MNATPVEQIAEAVLYEGYVLYPYRATSKKNRRERFSFGRVYPEAYSRDQNGVEPSIMQTECLVEAGSDTPQITVEVRFLHPLAREIGVLEPPLAHFPTKPEPSFRVVPELRIGSQLFQSWHEAVERRIRVPVLELRGEASLKSQVPLRFAAKRELEPIREGSLTVGIICRRQELLEGRIDTTAHPLQPGLWKLTARIANLTPVAGIELRDREAISLRTFASTHTVLSVQGGQFISAMDPPAELKEAARQCRNMSTWPVLVGDEARPDRDTMLSSPIILYDYPRIAPESAGPLFDGTEFDEMLTLRILTLTDQEKLEMAGLDEQGRRLLERTVAAPEALSRSTVRFTGALRSVLSSTTSLARARAWKGSASEVSMCARATACAFTPRPALTSWIWRSKTVSRSLRLSNRTWRSAFTWRWCRKMTLAKTWASCARRATGSSTAWMRSSR